MTTAQRTITVHTSGAHHEVTVQADSDSGVWVITDDGSPAGAMSFITATELREFALGRHSIMKTSKKTRH